MIHRCFSIARIIGTYCLLSFRAIRGLSPSELSGPEVARYAIPWLCLHRTGADLACNANTLYISRLIFARARATILLDSLCDSPFSRDHRKSVYSPPWIFSSADFTWRRLNGTSLALWYRVIYIATQRSRFYGEPSVIMLSPEIRARVYKAVFKFVFGRRGLGGCKSTIDGWPWLFSNTLRC